MPPDNDNSALASSGPVPADAHLVFVPEWATPRFFLWGSEAGESSLAVFGEPSALTVVDAATKPREVSGYVIPCLDAVRSLAAQNTDAATQVSASIAVWSLASKLLLELVARERCVPRVVATAQGSEARWAVALSLPDDAQRVAALAKSFPLAAHALPLPPSRVAKGRKKPSTYIWRSDALLRAFLDRGIDLLLRAAVVTKAKSKRKEHRLSAEAPWPERFGAALACAPQFAAQGFAERTLLEDLNAWAQPALGGDVAKPRLCFRFELPAEQENPQFEVRYFLQASDEPSTLIDASEVFVADASLQTLHCTARVAEEQLLKSLAAAGRLFAPIERSLHQPRPVGVTLKAEEAWQFINEAAPALSEAGMGVILPAELTRDGQRRLRMRMHVAAPSPTSRAAAGEAMLTLENALLSFKWQAEIDGRVLTQDDLQTLAASKAPLVKFRGQWVAVDASELAQAQKLIASGGGKLSRASALAAALGGTRPLVANDSSLPVEVTLDGALARLLAQLQTANDEVLPAPQALQGELRPYQQRGLAWLSMMAHLHVGACLADDMGLGKTIQLLSFLLHRRERATDPRPILLVCPTSVIGNWQREIAKFAPSLPVYAHYGIERHRSAADLAALPAGSVVITSYGLLRRDAAVWSEVLWAVAVLDEAQNIKNAQSRTARAARALHADFRVALTGTPVENRLAELWSICEFLNPGLLGPFETFRREIAIPIERFGRDDVAERLQHVVRPLILRRVKSDPAIIQDLPPKQESTVYCSLTREQAALYRAALDDSLEAIEGSDGIERRGHVLALITALKQICNHPAQYLREAGPLSGRSGKLERLREMLEEALAGGDRVLIFTQYREMGTRLVKELTRCFGHTVQYLHGGTSRDAREAMIRRFQHDANGPRIFVLSLKAGGTGLNLTAATQVFHYDRWWNPAVEDQATDRAYRIGQDRKVQVHKFLCAGTIEERINQMLESKRDLAQRIVGQGEQWITELSNEQLRELFALAPNAVVGGEDAEDGDEELPPPRKRKTVARASA